MPEPSLPYAFLQSEAVTILQALESDTIVGPCFVVYADHADPQELEILRPLGVVTVQRWSDGRLALYTELDADNRLHRFSLDHVGRLTVTSHECRDGQIVPVAPHDYSPRFAADLVNRIANAFDIADRFLPEASLEPAKRLRRPPSPLSGPA